MNKPAFVAIIAVSVATADQLNKVWLRAALARHDSIDVVPGLFSIVHACNPGGAFSFLAGANEGWRLPFFFIASTLAIVMLFYFLRQVHEKQRVLQFALAGILGGAIGNLIDRAWFGCVTDFLEVYWGRYHWPAFNVADSFISIGVVILFAHSLFVREEQDPGESRAETSR